jgi:hypothetical protein
MNYTEAIHVTMNLSSSSSLPIAEGTASIGEPLTRWALPKMYPQLTMCLRANDTLRVNLNEELLLDHNLNISNTGFTIIRAEQPLTFIPLDKAQEAHRRERVRRPSPFTSPRVGLPCIRAPYPYHTHRSGTEASTISTWLPFDKSNYDYMQQLDPHGNVRLMWKCEYAATAPFGDIIIVKRLLDHIIGRPVLLVDNADDIGIGHSPMVGNDRDGDQFDGKNDDTDFDNDDDEWYTKLLQSSQRGLQRLPGTIRIHYPRYRSRSSQCTVSSFALQVRSKGIIQLGIPSLSMFIDETSTPI